MSQIQRPTWRVKRIVECIITCRLNCGGGDMGYYKGGGSCGVEKYNTHFTH